MATSRSRRPWLIVLGAAMALGIPAASCVVAALWSAGWIVPDPDGALVHGLQALSLSAAMLAPFGLAVATWAAGARRALIWVANFLWGIPVLAVVWFVAVAWLGGLAGEPF
jgi:hypothetical protein